MFLGSRRPRSNAAAISSGAPAFAGETRPVVRAGGIEIPMTVELPGGPLPILLRRSPRARRLRLLIDHRRGVVVTVPLGRGRLTPEVSAGRGPGRDVERFLAEREAWIRRHADRQAASAARAAAGGELRDGMDVLFRGSRHRLAFAQGTGRRSRVVRVGGAERDELLLELAPGDRRPPERVLREWFVERARAAVDAAIAAHAEPLGVAPAAVAVRDQRTRWGSASRTGRLAFSWRLVLAPPEALETVVVHELAHLRVFGHGEAFWALVASRRADHVTWRRWLRRHAAELHATLA